MTFSVPFQEITKAAPPSHNQVTQIEDVIYKIREDAIVQTYAKMVPVQQSLGLEFLLQHHDFFQSFKYNIAKGIAEALGTNDKQVQKVYLFEPSANPDAETGEYLPLEAIIHLLVVASKPSAALDTLIQALDQSLAGYLNEMPSPLLAERHSILDVVVLTQEAVEQRQGYASLVSSILAPSFKLWEREA